MLSKNSFNSRKYFYYYLASLLSLLLIGWAKGFAHETNLPPLEPFVRLVINGLYLNLAAAFYLLVSRSAESAGDRKNRFLFFAVASLFCFLWPVFSGDLMEYLIRGRILGVYHQSPYRHVPAEFPGDLLYRYSTWKANPDSYGPIGVWLETIPALIFPHSARGMIAVEKFIFLGFMAAAIFFFSKIVEVSGLSPKPRLAALFGFSPLLIVSSLIDGHNDVVMLAFTVGAVYFLLKKRTTRLFLFLTLAFLVKYTVLLVAPILAALALGEVWKEKKIFPALFALREIFLNAAIIFIAFAPLWGGRDTFLALIRASDWFYTNTLPYAFSQLVGFFGLKADPHFVKYSFLGAFAALYAVLFCRVLRSGTDDPQKLFRTLCLVYLFFYCTITIPFGFHYLLWALPWLVLSRWPMDIFLVTLYSFTGLFSYFKRMNYLILIACAVYAAALLWRRHGHRFSARVQ
ncbi:MAG: hypothetical protein HYZ52_04870 [Candidatus Omnitrophica bacterium]|nr:hypothetical protein [Candidatus Omnitrophota bacterium]